ncbi:zinc ribbon domain-containing protein [Parabacteroides sp.]
MAFCSFCGTQVPDGIKFCTACGKPMASKADRPITQPTQPVQPTPQPAPQPMQQPVYPQQPPPAYGIPQGQPYAAQPYSTAADPNAPLPPGSKYEPVTTGGFIGIMLLMLIPIVNIILLLVWACGGCRKVNQANFARAMLILLLIGIILGAVVTFVFQSLWKETIDSLLQDYGGLKDLIPAE